jgi:hypothetical protein
MDFRNIPLERHSSLTHSKLGRVDPKQTIEEPPDGVKRPIPHKGTTDPEKPADAGSVRTGTQHMTAELP